MEYKLNSYSKIIELKALMTRVAKGEITMEEAGFPAKPKKVALRVLKTPKNTHTRTTKTKGGKK